MCNNPFIERAAEEVFTLDLEFASGPCYVFRFPNGCEVTALDPGELADDGWGPWVVTTVDRRTDDTMTWPDLEIADVRDRLYTAATAA
jgi:hypothetical protein